MQEIRIGRLNGAFVACWWEENGKRRRFRLKSKTRQEAISEALRVKDAQRALEGHHLTFQDLKDNYSKYLGARRTAHQVEEVWKCMGPALGGFRVDQIDDDVMESFLVERQRQAMERRGRPLSNGTLWTDVNIAQSIFNYAKKKNKIDFELHLNKPTKPAPKEIWFNRPKVIRLLEEVKHTPHLYTATLLMLSTAGRVAAILELTWDRVDFEKGTIDLRVDSEAPRKGRAFIPMNEGLRKHLLKVKEAAEAEGSAYVVTYRGGQVASIYKAFKAHCRRAGLPEGSPHVLRHTAAIHMVAAGCRMAKVSQYLGHSSISTTQRIYARFQPEHFTEEARAVDFLVDFAPA